MKWRLFPRQHPNARIDHGNFTVLDTETTGFDHHKDRILSIGLVRMRQGKILLKESVEIFINQGIALDKSAFIHGITQEQLASGLQEKDALKQFLQFIGDDILVAHYATFDQRMIHAALERQGLAEPSNLWLDTMDIEQAIHPETQGKAESLKLDTLLRKKGINAVKRHSALGDAYSTALLLQKQLSECAANNLFECAQIHRRRTNLL